MKLEGTELYLGGEGAVDLDMHAVCPPTDDLGEELKEEDMTSLAKAQGLQRHREGVCMIGFGRN